MRTMYVVKIQQHKDGPRYLRVTGCDYYSHQISLVKKRSAATRFASLGLANLVSEFFWMKRWNDKQYDFRKTEDIRVRAS